MSLRFFEIPRDTEKHYRGAATLLEVANKDTTYITLSFDAPTRDGETLKTYPIHIDNHTDLSLLDVAKRTAKTQASIEGYQLIIPDNFFIEED